MQFSIQKNIETKNILSSLPNRFRELIDPSKLHSNLSTLIVFGGEKVVRSKIVKAALEDLTAVDRVAILAFAYNFTEDAKNLLREQSILIFTEREFFWTDERYLSVISRRSEKKV